MRAKAKPARPVGVPLPDTLRPELATFVSAPPATRSGGIFEAKFDGYLMIAHVDPGDVRIFSRNVSQGLTLQQTAD